MEITKKDDEKEETIQNSTILPISEKKKKEVLGVCAHAQTQNKFANGN